MTTRPDNRAELEAALRKYGQHRPNCNAVRALPFERRAGTVACSCGFDAALSSDHSRGLEEADVERALLLGWKACRTQVFALNEDTAERYGKHFSESSNRGSFSRGRILEAKSIAKALDALGPENCDELAKARAAIAALGQARTIKA